MSYKCVVGDVVKFNYETFTGTGVVKFVGSLLPNKKGLWVGIERTIPKSKEFKDETQLKPEGYNGKLGDMQYFTVKKGRGIFIPYDHCEVIKDTDISNAKQTELQKIPAKSEKEYSPTEDEKTQSTDANDTTNTKQQLQKAQKLLEASLLLLHGQSVDKSQVQKHCEQSWQFLNKKYPPLVSPILQENDVIGADEEKFSMSNITVANDMSIEKIKQILTDFMTRYSQVLNWKKSDEKSYGENVDSFVLMLDKTRTIEVRMSFLYSIMQYLIHITGVNKRCIAHGTLLIMIQQHQIDTLAKEMRMILETLLYNNDDLLWKYVYTMISNVFKDFKNIQPYSGKRITVENNENVSVQ
eukprot:321666_1